MADRDSFTGIIPPALQTDVLKRLQRCSQLGLKSTFLHEEQPPKHNRWHHTASVAFLAMVWYESLLPQRGKACSWAWTQEGRLTLALAMLFHDARHLPFSHMMEEVLQELNWSPVPPLSWSDVKQLSERLTNQELAQIGMTKEEIASSWGKVTTLQEGKSGVPWLEAIVDSALDADKIEYVFHDTELTKQKVRLSDWQPWFETFLSGQSLTPEGLIRLEGESCRAAFDLLLERMYLYRRLYLAPELRALECLARYIVVTWLKWKVPDAIMLPKGKRSDFESDLRVAKSKAAQDLLWTLFEPAQNPPAGELAGLQAMVADLRELGEAGVIDPAAVEWLAQLWKRLEVFISDRPNPTLQDARKQYALMNPIGPLYVHSDHEDVIRKIVRNWRVHYPLVALVDVAKFPRFLATPGNRKIKIGVNDSVAEQFLVPGTRPSEWHQKARATTPLHHCDFSSFELPVLQILIMDPWGEPSGGSSFLHEMLLRELQRQNIHLSESPEGAAHQSKTV
jgi:hypothetical protein